MASKIGTAPRIVIESDDEDEFIEVLPLPPEVERIAKMAKLIDSTTAPPPPALEPAAFAPVHDKSSPELKRLVAAIAKTRGKVETLEKSCDEVHNTLFFRKGGERYEEWLATMRQAEPKIDQWFDFVGQLLLKGAQLEEIEEIPKTWELEFLELKLFLLKKQCLEMQLLLQDPSFRKARSATLEFAAELLKIGSREDAPVLKLEAIASLYRKKVPQQQAPLTDFVKRALNQLRAQMCALTRQAMRSQYKVLKSEPVKKAADLEALDPSSSADATFIALENAPTYLTPLDALLKGDQTSTEKYAAGSALPSAYSLKNKWTVDYYVGNHPETWRVYYAGEAETMSLVGLSLEVMKCLKILSLGYEKLGSRGFEEEYQEYRNALSTHSQNLELHRGAVAEDPFNSRTEELIDKISGMEKLCDIVQDRWLLLHGLTVTHGDLFALTRRLREDLTPTEDTLKRSVHFYFTAKQVLEARQKKRISWPMFPMDNLVKGMLELRWETVTAIAPKIVQLSREESLVFAEIMSKGVIPSLNKGELLAHDKSYLKSYLVKRITSLCHLTFNVEHQVELALIFDAFEKDPVLKKALETAKSGSEEFASILDDFKASPKAHPFSSEQCTFARKALFMLHKAEASHDLLAFTEGWQALCDLPKNESEAMRKLQEIVYTQLSKAWEKQGYIWPQFKPDDYSLIHAPIPAWNESEATKVRWRALGCLCFGKQEEERAIAKRICQEYKLEDYKDQPVLFARALLKGICKGDPKKLAIGEGEKKWLLTEYFPAYFDAPSYDSSDLETLKALFRLVTAEKGQNDTPFTNLAKSNMKERYDSFIKDSEALFPTV